MNDQGNSRGWWCICWVSFSIMSLASSQGNIWCITVTRDHVLETESVSTCQWIRNSLSNRRMMTCRLLFLMFVSFANNRSPLAFSLNGLMGGGLEPVPAQGTPWTSLLLVAGLRQTTVGYLVLQSKFHERSMFVQTKTQMMCFRYQPLFRGRCISPLHVQVSLLPDS